MVLEWTLAQNPINKYRLPAFLVHPSRGISLERGWGGRKFTVHADVFLCPERWAAELTNRKTTLWTSVESHLILQAL